ncbi:proto-oncogene Mas-like [Heteronotia binoei]|uniref:proto-oncogene Mas-like n=1 Tax=Heteronotia binoei TaxID=13085 RepID=UPI00292D57A4|nr:proto-oncogene Mas-like [Heteronotia binoei]
MTNFSKITLTPVEDGPPYGDMYNTSSNDSPEVFGNIIAVLTSCICIIGLVGNGIVICLLGFYIKRSPFMTYILNLAVTDFGVLLFFALTFISSLTHVESLLTIAVMTATFMYNTSQYLLTAISIDRCVSVLFPIWHRCHRPPNLSTIVCALIWVLSFLTSGIIGILSYFEHIQTDWITYSPFLAGTVICLTLVSISTMILLFKVFYKSQRRRRGRLLTIVLLTLLFFLIFAFPLNAMVTLSFFTPLEYGYLILCGFLCACLNSCVNPLIYYVVGRKKRVPQRQSLKVILQRAFEEKEEPREERGTTAQTSL